MQADRKVTTGEQWPALTTATIDQFTAALDRVDGVKQIMRHLAGSALQVDPEALDAVADSLNGALDQLIDVREKLRGNFPQ